MYVRYREGHECGGKSHLERPPPSCEGGRSSSLTQLPQQGDSKTPDVARKQGKELKQKKVSIMSFSAAA